MKKPLHYTAFIIVLILTAATGCILDDDSDDNNETARENMAALSINIADKKTGEAVAETGVALQRQPAGDPTERPVDSFGVTDENGRVRFTVGTNTRYFLTITRDGFYDIHGHMVEMKEKDRALTIKIVSTDNADNTFTVDPADAGSLTDIGTAYTAVDINPNAVVNLLNENGIQQIALREAAASEVTAVRRFLNPDEHGIGSYLTFSFSETDTGFQSLQAADAGAKDFSGFTEAAIALNRLSSDPEIISPGNCHLLVVIKNAKGTVLFRQPVIRTDGQYLYGQIPLVYKGDLADSVMVFLTYAAEREQQPASTEIVSVEDMETIEVDYDTPLADIALPDRVTVKREDGLTANVSVNWDKENISPAYAPRQPGEYLITGALDIEDFSNLTNPETVSVSVIVKVGPPPNRAPELQAPENKSIAENEELKFTVSAEDADEDPLTYTAGGDLAGRFDPETATFQWKPGYDDSGEYQLSVTVSDGALTDSETVAIAVENTDRAPVLDPIGDKTATGNIELDFTVAASDPDGDPVTLSAGPLPPGAGFDPETGQFSWIPGDDQAGSHEITFTAKANGLRDSKTVTIHVEAGADPVTLSVTTRGEGTVTPAAGSHDYREGETVRCTASPGPGYVFSHWEVGIVDKSDATITVTMDQDKTVTAIFQEVFYDLNIAADGTGSVTPAAGHHTFHKDKQVSLTATPGAQCNFSHWRGDVADPNSAETTVTMDDDKSVTAVFSGTISGRITGVDSGDGIEGITIDFSDGSSTATDSEGNWSQTVSGTVTVTPAGSDQYYGEIFGPESKTVSGPDDTVDFTFSGYRFVADVDILDYTGDDDMFKKGGICAEILYDESFVFITGKGSIHRFKGAANGGNYSYEGKFGQYGSGPDVPYTPPYHFKNPQDLDVVVGERTNIGDIERRMTIADTNNDDMQTAFSFVAGEADVWRADKAMGLNHPRGITTVSLYTAYIADTGNDRILKVDMDSFSHPSILKEWRCSDIGDDFDKPQKIAADHSGNIYVSEFDPYDHHNARIFKYDGSSWRFFDYGFDVTVDSDNNVYLAGNPYIHIVDGNGNDLTQIDTDKTDTDILIYGSKVDVDSAGNIFVYYNYPHSGFMKFSPVD